MSQLTLGLQNGPLEPLARKANRAEKARKPPKPSIDQRFAEFWTANPHVYIELKRLAFERLARGDSRVGVKALWEELRSHLKVAGTGDYKLNNDFTALYARKLIQNHPELAAVIEVRKRKGEK